MRRARVDRSRETDDACASAMLLRWPERLEVVGTALCSDVSRQQAM